MAYDSLIWLSGTTSDAKEVVTATGNASGVNVGADRMFIAEVRVGGVVSGTSPTLDIVVQDSADNSTYATVLTIPQKTATDVGYQTGTTAVRTEVPASTNVPVRFAIRTKVGRPWLRIGKTIGGTVSPTFNGMSVVLIPVKAGRG